MTLSNTTTADDFISDFSAHMAGFDSANEYHDKMKLLISHLEDFKNPGKIKNKTDLKRAWEIKSALCGLSCYVFNNNLSEDLGDKVSLYSNQWYNRIVAFNRTYLVKDSVSKALANYLLWNYYFSSLDPLRVLQIANKRGLLRRKGNEVFVVGIQKKVGDNVFTPDRMGREHRHYLDSCGLQMFSLSNVYLKAIKANEAFIEEVPVVDEELNYRETYVGDGKGCARYVKMTSTMRNYVLELVR